MNRWLQKSLISSLMAASLLACGLLTPGTGSPSSAATPAQGSGPGTMLLQDDFSDSNSGWPRRPGSEYSQDYQDGQYRISVDQDQAPYVFPKAVLDTSFGDVRIELDVTRVSGADSTGVYLICRHVDQDNFYYAELNQAYGASLGAYKNDEQTLFVEDVPLASFDSDTNHVRFDCIGSSLTLYLNGELVTTANDGDFSEGGLGFGAGGAGEGLTDFRFDNFVVYAPVESSP